LGYGDWALKKNLIPYPLLLEESSYGVGKDEVILQIKG
jgi:hypothetical protein